jgi:hypothetical protein
MISKLAQLAASATIVAALSACQSEGPSARVAAAGSVSPVSPVTTPAGCGDDGGGFGANVRHFGETTPWSESPFLNPCWPN